MPGRSAWKKDGVIRLRKRPELDTSSATVRKVFLFVAAHVSCAGEKDLEFLTE